MTNDIRARIRFLKHEAKEAGCREMYRACVRILDANFRLYDYKTGELVLLLPDEPATAYVWAIVNSLASSHAEGVTTYQGRSVYAQTYCWSTAP
jgi:predicted secreted protein